MYIPTRPRRPGDPPPPPLARQLGLVGAFFAAMFVLLAVAFYFSGAPLL